MINDRKNGVLFGLLGVFFVGLQPIIAIARPKSLDSYFFAVMTCLIEAAIFFPLIFVERKINRDKGNSPETNSEGKTSLITMWKQNFWFFIFIG
ncbi:MAG: hypothetical protein P8Y23_12005, partial [Candidatus Lokiarchaeota archaeon]